MENTLVSTEVAILETDYVKATYNPELRAITVTWDGQISSENYRNTYTKVLDFQRDNDAPTDNFMADLRKQGVVNPNDRKWFETEAMPRGINQGLKRAAVITDANVFKKYYLNLIIKALNKFGLPLKLFGTPEEAVTWFKSFE